MTRCQIITELFTSKDFNQCIRKMKPEHLQDELKAEVALILCEKPDQLIVELWELGKLRFYTVRIILNLIQSKSSPFYKKFRDVGIVSTQEFNFQKIENFQSGYDEMDDRALMQNKLRLPMADTDMYDHRKDHAIAEIDNLYWYDREILKLYAEHGTYRKVEEVTGIPFESIYKTVQKNCLLIRRKVA